MSLVLSVLVSNILPVNFQIRAADDIITWTRVRIPGEGDNGGWVLSDDAKIECLEIAADDILYCATTPSDTGQTLFRSSDNGISWTGIGGVTDDIVEITAVPGSAADVYYATDSAIYKSSDAGFTFIPLPALPCGVGSGNLSIRCIDTCKTGGFNLVAAGTVDKDAGEYGGVYILDESEDAPAWTDTDAGEYDIYSLSFFPEYFRTGYLAAVAVDDTDICISTMSVNGNWNQDIGQSVIPGLNPVSTVLAFPDSNAIAVDREYLFIGINSGNGTGDVFKIELEPVPADSTATDLNIGADFGISGVDVSGLDCGGASPGLLIAGEAGNSRVYRSNDGGISWTRSVKPPTGQSGTLVLVDNNFTENNRMYAASAGTESGLSRSDDGGISWNQISFVNTEISSSCLVDLAVSPGYQDDETLFMLTFDSSHLVYSVWRTENGGTNWQRIFSSSFDDIDDVKKLALSPSYGLTEKVLYLAGTYNGTPTVWKTTDGGNTFTMRYCPHTVDEWFIVDDNELILGCYDGSKAVIYTSNDSGNSYSSGTALGGISLSSITVSPDYTNDGVILAGNSNGRVYYSEDRGMTFKLLPPDTGTTPLEGPVNVGIDTGFTHNRIVYAAGNNADNGIYRFIIGRSDEWDRIDGILPDGARISGLVISETGVLYAVNSQTADISAKEGGIERCLNPSFQFSPTFETVVRGLDDDTILKGVWISGDRIWTFDTANTRLLTFNDTLTEPVILKSPVNGTAGTDTRNVLLDWEVLDGAVEYRWEVDFDGAFTSIPSDFEGSTSGSSIRLPQLDTDTRYHWRVRAVKPVLSQWSEKWSFTTALGDSVVGPQLISPGAGAELISPEPVFQWSAIDGADKYELVVSNDVSFEDPVIEKTGRYALPATAWKSNVALEEGDTYYWKVRAVGSESYSDWSAVSVFVTETSQVSEQLSTDIGSPLLLSPGAGSGKVSLKPLFQWDAILGAVSYELVVSADTSFDNPVILKTGEYALPATAWKSNIRLESDTAYYWKVRALVGGSYSSWSPVSAFSTEAEYEESSSAVSEENESQLPAQPQAVTVDDGIPDWAVYLGIGLLAAIVLLQTTTLLVVVILRLKQR